MLEGRTHLSSTGHHGAPGQEGWPVNSNKPLIPSAASCHLPDSSVDVQLCLVFTSHPKTRLAGFVPLTSTYCLKTQSSLSHFILVSLGKGFSFPYSGSQFREITQEGDLIVHRTANQERELCLEFTAQETIQPACKASAAAAQRKPGTT